MNILLFTSTLDPTNGYGNITIELCSRLQNIVNLTVFVPKNTIEKIETLNKTKIISCLPPYIYDVKNIHALKYLIWQSPPGKFDVIHSLFEFPYALLAAKMAKQKNIPLIIGAQGTYALEPLTHQPEKYLLTQAYNQAKYIHAPSIYTAQKIKELSSTSTTIIEIPNGVNFQRFQKKPKIAQLNKNPLLIGVGGLKRRKGFDISIKAISLVKKKFPSIQYIIAGEGKEREKLSQLIHKKKLQKNVFLVGNKTGDELVQLFHKADIYLHTPRNEGWNLEGFGIVYIEAAACGKPSIGSLSGGVPSAIIHEKTGLLVKEENIKETAEAINRLLSDRELYGSLSRNALEWAKQHDWDVISKIHINIYTELIKATNAKKQKIRSQSNQRRVPQIRRSH